MRVFLASIISSLSIVPLYFILMALNDDLSNGLFFPMLVGALAVAAGAIFCVAVPLHFLLLRMGRARGHYYVLAGLLLPTAVTLAINPFGADVASWVKWQALAMGVMGAVVAGIFWKIASGKSSD
jgi:hypothetical protein